MAIPYNHREIEEKWRKEWEAHPVNVNDGKKPKYYCLDMFPYPSGNGLHVGHWRGYVISDVWSRYKMLNGGHYIIHPMGWDAFGLPAENYAIKMGVHPAKSTAENVANIKRQINEIAALYDLWYAQRDTIIGTYQDTPEQRIPLSQNKEFKAIKNAVIQEAERLRLGEISFEEKGLNQQDEPEEYRNASYDYWTLRDVIRDESLTMEERGEAVSEMERLAESGDMYAQYLMGKLWRDGPLLIPDSVEARYWFEQAADQGHLVAQYSLAKLYLSDDLEVRDTRKGMNWLYTAAVNGSHYAMYRLAKECLKGEHIQKDTARAVEWFTRSAERGNPYAQYMLGKLYLTGTEAPYDEERAIHWLTRSAEQGNQYAQYLLNHLEENRPPSAMLAVTRLLHHMSRIFRDNSVPKSRPGGIQIDRKRLKKLQEKRIAMGHKPDDHEQQWPDMTM